MTQPFARIPEPRQPISNRQVDVVRGQYHKFVLIPIMQHHTHWFDAGPISIGVERRALGSTVQNMVRGPSIHVCNADRSEEYVRFDVFGKVPHYHYILNEPDHNVVWGYDPATNGPMIPWAIAALRDRLPTLLRHAQAESLAQEIEMSGWDSAVLDDVEKAASQALAPSEADLDLAHESTAWMGRWKQAHPQFNTVEEGEY